MGPFCTGPKSHRLYLVALSRGGTVAEYATRVIPIPPTSLHRALHRHPLRRVLPVPELPATLRSRSEYAEREWEPSCVQQDAGLHSLGTCRPTDRRFCPAP